MIPKVNIWIRYNLCPYVYYLLSWFEASTDLKKLPGYAVLTGDLFYICQGRFCLISHVHGYKFLGENLWDPVIGGCLLQFL